MCFPLKGWPNNSPICGSYRSYNGLTHVHMQFRCEKQVGCIQTRPRLVLKGPGPENRVSGPGPENRIWGPGTEKYGFVIYIYIYIYIYSLYLPWACMANRQNKLLVGTSSSPERSPTQEGNLILWKTRHTGEGIIKQHLNPIFRPRIRKPHFLTPGPFKPGRGCMSSEFLFARFRCKPGQSFYLCEFFENVFPLKGWQNNSPKLQTTPNICGSYRSYNGLTHSHMQFRSEKQVGCIQTHPRLVLKVPGPENRVSGPGAVK